MSLLRQIEANRRNAQRSTGPRTLEGKAASSQNALKHELTGKFVVLQRYEGAIRRTFYRALRELRALKASPTTPFESSAPALPEPVSENDETNPPPSGSFRYPATDEEDRRRN